MRKNGVLLSIISVAIMLFGVAVLFYSCSGSGGGGSTSSGKVALYATDDMSDHQQVIATINKVTIMNTGTGATCDVLTTPTTINIANLAQVLQLLNVADCPAVPYNRLHIEFNKSVDLMNHSGAQSSCSFTAFKDDFDHPNVLQCNGPTCTLDINGAVNVLVNQFNKVALDFNLKDFDVDNFGTPSCSVTMKVSPIHGDEFENLGHQEAITGLVSNLTTSTHTFNLASHDVTFNVLYSGITSTSQPGIDDILLLAQQDKLRTQVTASTFDFVNKTIDASKVLVKVEGLVSALTTTNFTLTYNMGKTINVDYSKAVVKGALVNGAAVEVKLYGFDSVGSDFLAALVEVQNRSFCGEDDQEGAIMGLVSNLTTSTHTFDLTDHDVTFSVLYSGITSTSQPGINDLLLRAQQDKLRTQVTASTFDFVNKTIDASRVLVKVEGLISALTTTNFTLTYDMGKTINVDYSKAVVKGALAIDVQAAVKLYGFDSVSSDFLAALVEVQTFCSDDQDQERESED